MQVTSRVTKSLGTYLTRQEAEAVAGMKEVIELPANGKVADRHGIELGTIVYLAICYGKKKTYMTHASAAECREAGVTPGPCNV